MKEFNINQEKRLPPTEEKEKDVKKPRIVPKVEALARIAAMKLQREKELNQVEMPDPEKRMVISVLPKIKGWVDKEDHRRERGDRTALESRAVFKWRSGADIQKAQERIALDRK